MATFERRVARGRRYWDNLSSLAPALERTAADLGSFGLEPLDLRAGHHVLDVGCGAGAAFPALCSAVGPTGRVVGIDFSDRMLQRARERIDEYGLTVELRRAEASRADVEPGGYDRAVAVFALSAMADVTGTLRTVRRALRPGGRLLVVDLDLVPRGRAAPVTRAVRGLYRSRAGASAEDLRAVATATFGQVRAVELPLGVGAGWAPLVGFVATA